MLMTTKSECPWTKVKEWSWPQVHMRIFKYSIHTNFYITYCKSFWEIHHLGIYPHKSTRNQIRPLHKKVKGQPGIIISINLIERMSDVACQVSVISAIRFWRRFSKVFAIYIWAWRPSWLCDNCVHNYLIKLSFPYPTEAPYEIWLWLAQLFLRRRCLKSVDDDGGLPILQAHQWAFGSGELKM